MRRAYQRTDGDYYGIQIECSIPRVHEGFCNIILIPKEHQAAIRRTLSRLARPIASLTPGKVLIGKVLVGLGAIGHITQQ